MPKIFRLQTIDSTHKFAIRLIEKGKTEECIIIAEKQTDGIGRCGRIWESPTGNLYTSVIRKLFFSRKFGMLSLAAAAAIHNAILYYIPNNLYLHWPNDVYYKGSKIAGILIAVVDCWVVISVVINVNSTPDGVNAICIKDVSGIDDISVDGVWRKVVAELDTWLDKLCVSGFFAIKNYWLRYVNGINCKVMIKNGKDLVEGIFEGIDDSGRLVLGISGQNLFVSSGDMFLNMEGIVANYE